MQEQNELQKIVEFLRTAIKMKETYRFTPKENGQYENDAEHTWSVVLLCMLLGNKVKEELKVDLNIERMLKMAIIHDIAEVLTGDTKTWDISARVSKDEKERKAVEEIFGKLPKDLRDEFLSLWNECEEKQTIEAKIVKSLDRLEPVLHRVLLGHGWENLSEDDPERTVEALDERQLARHEFSSVITNLYKEVRKETLDKKMLHGK